MFRNIAAAACAVLALTTSGAGPSSSDPMRTAPAPAARIVRVVDSTPTRSAVFIDSPAMGRVVQVQILHPRRSAPRPTYYLLDGVDSGPFESNWTQKTDVVRFFADKDVNVVLPINGKGTYYSNWQRPDPVLGVAQWETFLTRELPPLIDGRLHGNGRNVVGGLSMGGTAAAVLAARHPDLYRGVAVFSGCPNTLAPDAQLVVRGSIIEQGGNPDNMWGPGSGPEWALHDPVTNAPALRGKAIYVGVGSGIPGPKDQADPAFPRYLGLAVPLEAAAGVCVASFQTRLALLGIPGTFAYHAIGTHAWPYWQDDLHDSWPMLAAALAR